MAGSSPAAAPDAVSASSPESAPSDPLTSGKAAFTAAFDELAAAPTEPGADAEEATGEESSGAPQAKATEPAPEHGATTETDTQDRPNPDAPEPTKGSTETPLKPKDEAVLAALREKDPAAYQEVKRLLQGVEDRASERAYQRLQKAQTVQKVQDTAPSMQADYEALQPEERSAWVETLPEVQAIRTAMASDLAAILGVDRSAFTPEVVADVAALQSVLLSGSVASAHLDAKLAEAKADYERQLKEADEAGYRRGKAEARGSGALPPTGTTSPAITAPPKTPEEAFKAFREGLSALTAA